MSVAVLVAALLLCGSSVTITNEVPRPTAYTLPSKDYSHTFYQGANFQEFKPEISSAVYSYRLLNELPENASCMFRLPELESRKSVHGPMTLWGNESISQLVAVSDKHTVYATTTEGRLLKFNVKHKIELEAAQVVGYSGIHLIKTTTNQLYLYDGSGLSRVKQNSQQFTLESVRKQKNILKALHYNGQIILLFRERVELWTPKTSTTETISLLGICDDLVDMDVYDGKVFLLSAKMGIAVASLLNYKVTLFGAPDLQGSFTKLKTYGASLFLLYRHRHKDFVVELFYDSENRIDLNKIYRYLRNIKDFVFFENFAVFASDTTLYYVRHSINRNIGNDTHPEVIFRQAQFGIKSITRYDDSQDSFVVATHNTLAVINVKHLSMIPVFSCEFGTAGTYTISIEYYEASCKQGNAVTVIDPRSSYCVHTINYHFDVKPLMSENKKLVLRLVLSLLLVLGVIIMVICLMRCRRVAAMKQNILEKLRQKVSRFTMTNKKESDSKWTTDKKQYDQKVGSDADV